MVSSVSSVSSLELYWKLVLDPSPEACKAIPQGDFIDSSGRYIGDRIFDRKLDIISDELDRRLRGAGAYATRFANYGFREKRAKAHEFFREYAIAKGWLVE